MRYYCLLIIIFILSCKKKDSQINPVRECNIPTEISIENKPSGIITVSLINTDSTSIGKVTWVISSASKSVTIETSGKSFVKTTFQESGDYHATALVETVCGQKVTLTRTSSIKLILGKVWEKNIGPLSDTLHVIISTNDGGYLIGGDKQVSAPQYAPLFDSFKSFVVYKVNASGDKVWEKSFDGTGVGNLCSITKAQNGGYLIGGNYMNYGPVKSGWYGWYDYRIIKIDDNGNKVWERVFGGEFYDYLGKIISTSDGGFILAGSSLSKKYGDKSEASRGGEDYWVVKINSDGNKIWDKTIGGSGTDLLSSIIETNDGSFVLLGSSNSNISFDKSNNSVGDFDYWVVKINKDGQKLWDKTYGGTGIDYAQNILLLADGNLIIGGDSYSNQLGDKTSDSKGQSDYWIIKINSNGQKVWDKTIGGNSYDNLASIFSVSDGGYILAGNSSSSLGFDNTTNNNDRRNVNWLVKLNSAGEKQWDQSIYRDQGSYLISIAPSLGNGYMLLNQAGDNNWLFKVE